MTRRPFGVAGIALALAALVGCGSSASPHPTQSAGLLKNCNWGSGALQTPGRGLFYGDGNGYQLVDLSSGAVLGRCLTPVADDRGIDNLGVQTPSYRGVRETPENAQIWYGALNPGGPHRSVVVTTSGLVDLADGARLPVPGPTWRAAGVGATEAIFERSGTESSDDPPASPEDWCVAALTDLGHCTAVPGASGAGTPTVTANGTVAWLTNALSRTGLTYGAGIAAGQDDHLWLRTAHGVVTAVASVENAGKGYTTGSVVQPRWATTDGGGFVDPRDPQGHQYAADAAVTWYTVSSDGALAKHSAGVTWADVGLAASDGGAMESARLDASGGTLYLVVQTTLGTTRVWSVSTGATTAQLQTTDTSTDPSHPHLGLTPYLLSLTDSSAG